MTVLVAGICTSHRVRKYRTDGFERVHSTVAGPLSVVVHEDDMSGPRDAFMTTLIKSLDHARDIGGTHVSLLPDDAIPQPFMVHNMLEAVDNCPGNVLDMMVNHPVTDSLSDAAWYCTVDGFVGFGGTMTVHGWERFLDWKDAACRDDASIPFDDLVNTYCMYGPQQELVYKPTRSIMLHDPSVPSEVGNDHQSGMVGRNGLLPAEGKLDLSDKTSIFMKRTYEHNVWRMFHNLTPEYARNNRSAERMYEVWRKVS